MWHRLVKDFRQGFDILGCVTSHKQTTDGVTYGNGSTDSLMTYTYNLGGALIEQQYPSGRVVKSELDLSGDLASVTSKENSSAILKTYANDFTYTAAGAVGSLKLGNGRFETTSFNSRLQPTQIGLGTSETTQNILKLEYGYGTTSNNGNVQSQTITVPTVGANTGFSAVQTYTYDELNRLRSATENVTPHGGSQSQSWKQTYTFDRYGNRRFDFTGGNTTSPASNCSEAICNPTVSTTNNRLTSTGYLYDDAGNTIRDAEYRTFTYDGENKQTLVKNSSSATIGEYFYDGDGKRVKKVVPSTAETTVFVYDAAGKLIGEYSTVVASSNDAKVAYLTTDHLSSPRITTDAIGQTTSRRDLMPFGEEILRSGYGDDSVRRMFTTYERDEETGLDFANSRTHMSLLGRFSTSDPIMLDSTRMNNPQIFNGYSYTASNPLRFTDPDGEDLVAADEETKRNIKRLAPGAKIDKNGNVKKPNFFRRVINRLTGHGDGTKLISQLVDSKKVVTAASLPGTQGGYTVDLDKEKAMPPNQFGLPNPSTVFKSLLAQKGTNVRDDTNILIVFGSASLNERMKDGTIQSNTADAAVILGHELIHAAHIIDGTFEGSDGNHNFAENGVNYVETQSKEELRTTGLAFNRPGDITENSLRRELGYRPRATYNDREKWKVRK